MPGSISSQSRWRGSMPVRSTTSDLGITRAHGAALIEAIRQITFDHALHQRLASTMPDRSVERDAGSAAPYPACRRVPLAKPGPSAERRRSRPSALGDFLGHPVLQPCSTLLRRSDLDQGWLRAINHIGVTDLPFSNQAGRGDETGVDRRRRFRYLARPAIPGRTVCSDDGFRMD